MASLDVGVMLSRVLQEQVRVMTDKWHVYMTFDGRISMAGLSSSKAHYLAEAIADAVRSA